MALLANKRSVMTLFSAPLAIQCHRARMVLSEKGIAHEVEELDPFEPHSAELIELNPYGELPVLMDRDLILYDARVIMEYLDERFPHPPLMPVDPVVRAHIRLALHRIERDWYPLVADLEGGDEKRRQQARKLLREGLTASAELFAVKPFFLNDELTLADCTLAPLLWRLPHFGVELPRQAKAVLDYAERTFRREGFRASLSAMEKELR